MVKAYELKIKKQEIKIVLFYKNCFTKK